MVAGRPSWRATLLLRYNGWHNRHARTQLVLGVFTFFEDQLDRDTLHHLHIVACCVLWRQETETCTCRSAEAVHTGVQLTIVGIDLDRHLLADSHVLELRLFEVGGYVNVIEIHKR